MGPGSLITAEHVWLAIGFLGQLLFSMRFLVQWIASEKRGESIIPVAFWYFSIGGGLLLFAYSIWRLDPVFIVGQSLGVFIYTRNLYLINRPSSGKAAVT
jgi:lipid-A-disaccharide synthase-like uncharacterized protein